MPGLIGVGMLEQSGAVEPGESVPVRGEVSRHPVQDHTQPQTVRGVDEVAEAVRVTVPGCGRKEAERLVSPTLVERMLRQGEQLDVREAEVPRVWQEFVRKIAVPEPGTTIRRARRRILPSPRAQVHLIHADRCAVRLPLRSPVHPLGIPPLEASWIPNLRGRRGAEFGSTSKGVCPLAPRTGAVDDLVLVPCAQLTARQEQLPDPGLTTHLHGMTSAVPTVHVAHEAHCACMRRPDGEACPQHAFVLHRGRPQHLVDSPFFAPQKGRDPPLVERATKPVGVVDLPFGPPAVRQGKPIRERPPVIGKRHLKQAGHTAWIHGEHSLATDHGGRARPRHERADDASTVRDGMHAQDAKGGAATALGEGLHVFGGHAPWCTTCHRQIDTPSVENPAKGRRHAARLSPPG